MQLLDWHLPSPSEDQVQPLSSLVEADEQQHRPNWKGVVFIE